MVVLEPVFLVPFALVFFVVCILLEPEVLVPAVFTPFCFVVTVFVFFTVVFEVLVPAVFVFEVTVFEVLEPAVFAVVFLVAVVDLELALFLLSAVFFFVCWCKIKCINSDGFLSDFCCGNLILLRNRFYGYSFFIVSSSFYNLRH